MFSKRDGFKIIRKKDFDQDGLLRGIRIVGGFQHNQAVKGSVWKFKICLPYVYLEDLQQTSQ